MAHIIEMFPESRIRLDRELRFPEHEPLWDLLAQVSPHEFHLRIGVIAGYCEVILDGEYTPSEIDKLCDILVTRLQEKRTGFKLEGIVH